MRRLSSRRLLVDGAWGARDDDLPETVRHRLRVHREVTAPLSDFYAAVGLLRRIEATGEVAEVTNRTLAALGCPRVPAG